MCNDILLHVYRGLRVCESMLCVGISYLIIMFCEYVHVVVVALATTHTWQNRNYDEISATISIQFKMAPASAERKL